MRSSAATPIEPEGLKVAPANGATRADLRDLRRDRPRPVQLPALQDPGWFWDRALAAGFTEVSPPSLRRAVTRIEFAAGG